MLTSYTVMLGEVEPTFALEGRADAVVVFVMFTFVVFVIMFNTLISLIADIFDRYMEQRVVEGLSAKVRTVAVGTPWARRGHMHRVHLIGRPVYTYRRI